MSHTPPKQNPLVNLGKAEKATLALLGRALAHQPETNRTTSREHGADILAQLQSAGLIQESADPHSIVLSPAGATLARELAARHFEATLPVTAHAPASAPPSGDASFPIENLPESFREVLAEHTAGPTTGVFTDGGARPNPGPGGWGVVYVENNRIIAQRCGYDPETTNNRMELTALIEAYRLLPTDSKATIHSDSNLCVQTVNDWAPNWKRRGWKKKDGEIKNLDLVKVLYGLAEEHPNVKLIWVKAHNGWRWNEYVDTLASAWTRSEKVPQFGGPN